MKTNDEPLNETLTETQIQKNVVDTPDNGTSVMSQLSNTVNEITSHLHSIVERTDTDKSQTNDDVRLLTYPLEDVVTFIWTAPSDKLFQERLYFLFDKLLDIVYCQYEKLDDAWHGVSYVIESKLSQISLRILKVVDEMKAISEQSEEDKPNDLHETTINDTIVDLTTSIVGLTLITTSTAQMITTRDRSVSLIIEVITSLILIHQYVVAAVVCLLSRAVIYSNVLVHATGLTTLTTTISEFLSKLESVLWKKQKETSMTALFHGDLHRKLSMRLLVTINSSVSTRMINMIYTTTVYTSNIIHKHASESFHILPDLIEQLAVISLRCGRTQFNSLGKFVTYAFDGLFDVMHHVSYAVDRHIQSSASTGSFQEPSEPIEMAVSVVKIQIKRFIHECQQVSNGTKVEGLITDLIASTSDLMQTLLDPMSVIVRKSDDDDDDDYSIILASSLQFIALYVIGLILTPLISLTTNLQNSTVIIGDVYSNFSAALSLLFIEAEMMFGFSNTENDINVIKGLHGCFDELRQNLVELDDTKDVETSRVLNAFIHLALEHKSYKPFPGS